MRLKDDQVEEFDRKGWILLPGILSSEECSVLTEAAFEVLERPGPEVARENDGSPHVCWGVICSMSALTDWPATLGF